MSKIRKITYERGALTFTYFAGQKLHEYEIKEIREELQGDSVVILLYIGDDTEYTIWKKIKNWTDIEYDYEELFSY